MRLRLKLEALTFIIFGSTLGGCALSELTVDYYNLGAYSENGFLQMVVEIPAGTNAKIEYDEDTNTFQVDDVDGEARIIDFLPYPGNYGFIPSTSMDKGSGGDGDAIDVLLMSSYLETGTIVEVLPIGILQLRDHSELDSKIIAIPADESMRIIKATGFEDFKEHYSQAKQLIKQWFLNYKQGSVVEFLGWGDELTATTQIHESVTPR